MCVNYEFVGNKNFRGKTPSDWMEEWVQWMHGASVYYRGEPGEVLFTRGGLSYVYEYPGGPRKQVNPDHKEEVYITNEVPVYINLRTAFYFLRERHPHGSMQTLDEVLAACRDDHARGRIKAAEIIGPDGKSTDLIGERTYVESFNISIQVHPNSILADQFEFEVERSTELRGCAVGDICFIKKLVTGKYNIKTSNEGARGYTSSSDYTINVGGQSIANPGAF